MMDEARHSDASLDADRPEQAIEVLLTAEEAYPALERAFLAAQREIVMGFRIFDPATRLHSPEARRIGDRWSDLILHVLQRGVAVRLILGDFDPIGAPSLHRTTWSSVRRFKEIAEQAGPSAKLEVCPSMHPAGVGLVARLAFLPVIVRKIADSAAALNELAGDDRAQALRDLPGLAEWLEEKPDGTLRPRIRRLPQLHVVTHHQKLAVFDGETLYIGGLDLNDRRFDTTEHDRDAEDTWHDVQVILRGPAAAEACRHLAGFLAVTEGDRPPERYDHLVTTLSARRSTGLVHIGPRTVDRTIEQAHHRFVAGAERLIYLETQFFRDSGLSRRLARAAAANPELSLILVLPGAPEEVAFTSAERTADRYGEWLQTRCIRRVAAAFGRRFIAASPVQPRRDPSRERDALNGAPLVYVHAKVSMFDTAAAIVSSANLNGRSFAWDTEAGVILDRPADVLHLRRRVFDHWLGPETGPEFFDPDRAVTEWRRRVLANADAEPADRRGFLVPYDVEAAASFGLEVPGVPEEMV